MASPPDPAGPPRYSGGAIQAHTGTPGRAPGVSQTIPGGCTYTVDFHFANGSVQFDNFTSSC